LIYGASIIYTSSKENINIEILYQYLVHRSYDFRFKQNAVPNDFIFIPSGYDSPNVIK